MNSKKKLYFANKKANKRLDAINLNLDAFC